VSNNRDCDRYANSLIPPVRFVIQSVRRAGAVFPVVHESKCRSHRHRVRPFADCQACSNLCGETLARAHARSGDAAQISGYLGRSDAFDTSIAEFAVAYAEQSTADHKALLQASPTRHCRRRSRALKNQFHHRYIQASLIPIDIGQRNLVTSTRARAREGLQKCSSQGNSL